jgi:glycosyltransferase involved in cell wall biosynthesis
MPKVSVIIPNYNHARFLPKRIESVLNQTFQDFEVIFLDDASSDDSLAVFEHYAEDQRICAFYNRDNSGNPFIQWKKGLLEAKGDYVWIAESDDFADQRFLEKLCPVLDANLAVGLVYCQSWLVDSHDKPLYENRQWTDDLDSERWRHSFTNSGKDEVARFLIHKNTIPNASAVLFRKDIAFSAGAIDENLRYCGDWLCWIKILLCSDISYVAESLNYWREAHVASMRGTIRSISRIREILHLLYFVQQRVSVNPKEFHRILRKFYTQWLRSALGNGVPWATHREIVQEFAALFPAIKMIDLAFAPLFLFGPLMRKQA